jgi:hypothetical protein
MSSSEISRLIAAMRTGSLSLAEVARRFRDRDWPETEAPEPPSYLELAAAVQRDPEPDRPGSFDEVTAAYDRGELSRHEYTVLSQAVAYAINTARRHDATTE